jgi:hypothetical protein
MRSLIQEEIQTLRGQMPMGNQVEAEMTADEADLLAEDAELGMEEELEEE